MPKIVRNGVEYGGGGYTKKQIDDKLDMKQEIIDGNNKISADLVDDSISINKFAHMDNSGGLWIGDTQYIRIMDSESYAALATKENIIYMVYPTPTPAPSLSMGGTKNEISEGGDEKPEDKELKEPIDEKEPIEELKKAGDNDADLQRDNGID